MALMTKLIDDIRSDKLYFDCTHNRCNVSNSLALVEVGSSSCVGWQRNLSQEVQGI